MAKKQTPSPYDLNATVKKRNPQDATLRNINALKKRIANLEAKQKDLDQMLFNIRTWIANH
jgi:polyhydroxyalkanoate synthesis regulator phasin